MRKFVLLAAAFFLVTFGLVSISSALTFSSDAVLLGGYVNGVKMPTGVSLFTPEHNDSMKNVNAVITAYNSDNGTTYPPATTEYKVDPPPFPLNGATFGTISDLMGAMYLSMKFGAAASGGGWYLWDISTLSSKGDPFVFAGLTGGGLSHYSLWNKGTVPEPATVLLLGTGLLGLAAFGRRKFKK